MYGNDQVLLLIQLSIYSLGYHIIPYRYNIPTQYALYSSRELTFNKVYVTFNY